MSFFSQNAPMRSPALSNSTTQSTSGLVNVFRWQYLLIPVLFVILRSAFAAVTELQADEAYYWVWSRSLAAGYFDHPPLVAALIRLSTALLGHSEWAVRLPAVLMGGGTIVAGTLLASLLGAKPRALTALQLALFAFPLLHVAGAIITPDTPAVFFVTLSLVAGILCYRQSDRALWWILLGAACGLAMLSKYTAVVPCSVLLLALAMTRAPNGWRAVMAGAIAAIILSPVLVWNYHHDWVSFRFQLAHGLGREGRNAWVSVGEYLGGLLAAATPILAVMMIGRGALSLRRDDFPRRLVALSSMATLGFFLVSSVRHKVEVNWPSSAWVPLLVLLIASCDLERAGRYRRWIYAGICVSGIMSFALMLPPAIHARVARDLPTTRTGGWSILATRLSALAAGRPVVCTRYQDAAIFSFYMPRQPAIPVLRRNVERPSQYDLWPMPSSGDAIFLVSDGLLEEGPSARVSGALRCTLEVTRPGEEVVDVDGLQARRRFYALCRYLDRDVTPDYRYSDLVP